MDCDPGIQAFSTFFDILRPSTVDHLVRILGVIAMIDDDETDWKVLTIALDDDKAQMLSTK
jgi:inorganic pyrophosphatase